MSQIKLALGNIISFRALGHFLNDRRWLFVALIVGASLYVMPTPEGLSREGHLVLILSVVSVILFVTEPIPLPTVALMIIVGQVFVLGVDSSTVARSLMSDSVLFIMGSLMLAVAIIKQKLDKRIAYLIVRITGTKTVNVATGIAVVSGILASFIGEHTVAAMMLPVVLTLLSLTSDDPKKVRNLAAILLFSIAYGCSIAGIGTPSGGARNAIMVGYWHEFYYNASVPETIKYLMHYTRWMSFAYPVFLAQLPFMMMILFFSFKPEHAHLTRAVVKLRTQIEKEGPVKPKDWLTVAIFVITLIGWIKFSDQYGLGTVALLGAIAFLVLGLVNWEDINVGVNWGVVLLYAAAISLGVEMKESGAALWLADSFLTLMPASMEHGPPLWASVSLLTTLVTNTMSNGAAVAVLGPIVLNLANAAGESPILMGFITAISSAFAYLTVIGTPASTIIYASGYLRTTDFLRVGFQMAIMSTLILIGAAVFYWPLLGL